MKPRGSLSAKALRLSASLFLISRHYSFLVNLRFDFMICKKPSWRITCRRFGKSSDRLYLNAPTVRILLYAVLDATDAVIKGAAFSTTLRSGRHYIGA